MKFSSTLAALLGVASAADLIDDPCYNQCINIGTKWSVDWCGCVA